MKDPGMRDLVKALKLKRTFNFVGEAFFPGRDVYSWPEAGDSWFVAECNVIGDRTPGRVIVFNYVSKKYTYYYIDLLINIKEDVLAAILYRKNS